ncbi:hypothetical protein K4K57_001158 [Colletotrichum sp. SAR 10_99]|nr:hypothetical protein K4K55_012034 [Colletotrichum sp. SAR 10_96]KAI8279440.1 hypothetical protein K4K56_012688 [Colletotrichum sp. SAR 10_98]KAJ5014718.1 hypothetical protein K4K57_001158 [Colletotrichum sp. SAR 10_99]
MGPGAEYSEYFEYGLDELRNNRDIGDQGVIFGDGTEADYGMPIMIYIFTPRPRPNSGHDDEIREDPNYLAGRLLYPERVWKLSSHMQETFAPPFAQASIELIDYVPRIPLRRENLPSQAQKHAWLGDNNIQSPRGKLLIQYQPAPDCAGKASWRFQATGLPDPVSDSRWYFVRALSTDEPACFCDNYTYGNSYFVARAREDHNVTGCQGKHDGPASTEVDNINQASAAEAHRAGFDRICVGKSYPVRAGPNS